MLRTSASESLKVIVLLGFALAGCGEKIKESDEEREKRYQRSYEQHFKMSMCLSMEVFVDLYEQEPQNYTFGLQGYGSKDDVTNTLYARVESMRRMTRSPSYYPKDFEPNPSYIPIEAVNQYCPELSSKFWRIPY